jgi:hypothetical protein
MPSGSRSKMCGPRLGMCLLLLLILPTITGGPKAPVARRKVWQHWKDDRAGNSGECRLDWLHQVNLTGWRPQTRSWMHPRRRRERKWRAPRQTAAPARTPGGRRLTAKLLGLAHLVSGVGLLEAVAGMPRAVSWVHPALDQEWALRRDSPAELYLAAAMVFEVASYVNNLAGGPGWKGKSRCVHQSTGRVLRMADAVQEHLLDGMKPRAH